MKKRNYIVSLFLILLMAFTSYSSATTEYYFGSGNYSSSAPAKPASGLSFYIDNSARQVYGSEVFTDIYHGLFEWNGDYSAHVSQVIVYPSPKPSYAFYIVAENLAQEEGGGKTLFYDKDGRLINPTIYDWPYDRTDIYRCMIVMNSNKGFFDNDINYFRKTAKHEAGHTFLLYHPSYVQSIMQVGKPNGAQISDVVTNNDRDNQIEKWD
jgi:hypothetical protein